jgi:hypothetical protein
MGVEPNLERGALAGSEAQLTAQIAWNWPRRLPVEQRAASRFLHPPDSVLAAAAAAARAMGEAVASERSAHDRGSEIAHHQAGADAHHPIARAAQRRISARIGRETTKSSSA